MAKLEEDDQRQSPSQQTQLLRHREAAAKIDAERRRRYQHDAAAQREQRILGPGRGSDGDEQEGDDPLYADCAVNHRAPMLGDKQSCPGIEDQLEAQIEEVSFEAPKSVFAARDEGEHGARQVKEHRNHKDFFSQF